jgi:hypothetical protein
VLQALQRDFAIMSLWVPSSSFPRTEPSGICQFSYKPYQLSFGQDTAILGNCGTVIGSRASQIAATLYF